MCQPSVNPVSVEKGRPQNISGGWRFGWWSQRDFRCTQIAWDVVEICCGCFSYSLLTGSSTRLRTQVEIVLAINQDNVHCLIFLRKLKSGWGRWSGIGADHSCLIVHRSSQQSGRTSQRRSRGGWLRFESASLDYLNQKVRGISGERRPPKPGHDSCVASGFAA